MKEKFKTYLKNFLVSLLIYEVVVFFISFWWWIFDLGLLIIIFSIISYFKINLHKKYIYWLLIIFIWNFLYRLISTVLSTINFATQFYNEEVWVLLSNWEFLKLVYNNGEISDFSRIFISLWLILFLSVIINIFIYLFFKNLRK